MFAYCLDCGQPLTPPTSPVTADTFAQGAALFQLGPDGNVGQEYLLSSDTNVLGHAAPITLPDDPWIQDRHAELQIGPEECTLTDLNTKHGTYLKIRGDTLLRNGDHLRIGSGVFIIELFIPAANKAAPDTTVTFGSSVDDLTSWGRLVRLGPDGFILEATRLTGPSVVIGRTSGDILLPEDPFVSSRHATLSRKGDCALLHDTGSRNGCFTRIVDRTPIVDGDHLLLGHQLLLFRQAVRKTSRGTV